MFIETMTQAEQAQRIANCVPNRLDFLARLNFIGDRIGPFDILAGIMRVFLVLAFFLVSVNSSFAAVKRPGHIYLLRGLANIFSTGMDTLAYELAARGYDATTHSHVEADSLAVQAASLQKSGKGPIIIMGHSLGGPAAIAMAKRMQDLSAKVALIVTFGPNVSDPVPSNVARVVNFYQTQSIVSYTMRKGPGFTGSISNINLDSSAGITHFNIDKIESLHRQAIAAVASVAGGSRSETRAAVPSPSPAPERRTEVGR